MADRISSLPDEILCHILSFVTTKEAAATSVLSKRWRSLWLSVPVLDLHDPDLNCIIDQKPFLEFVYFTILVRHPHQPFKRFTLTKIANDNVDLYPHMKIWLDSAAQCGIEHLHVDLRPRYWDVIGPRWNFPGSIFSCRTLVVLKLGQCNVTAFPSPVYLPSLKILHLYDVNFAESRHRLELLNGCPILEELETDVVSYFVYATKSNDPFIELKTLSKLVRASFGKYKIPLQAACNVEFLRLKKFPPSKIPKFPKLTHLELICDSCGDLYLLHLMLYHCCPKLQTFTLHMDIRRHNDTWFSTFLSSVPECISSQLRNCSFIEFEGNENEMTFAKYIIQKSRSLQIMKIKTKSSLAVQDKHELLKELSLCPRSSADCQLLFL